MFEIKEIVQPVSLNEAVSYLSKYEGSKIIAGGTDILIKLHHGSISNCSLISIRNINELREINLLENGDISIGSMVTFSELFRNDIVNKYVPILSESAVSMGGPQIRNVATIGGNVCNGAVSADSAPSLIVLEAVLKLKSIDEEREINILEFYEGPGKVKIKKNEILTEIIIKKENYNRYNGRYIKFSNRKALDISMLGVAVNIKLNNNKIDNLKIGLGVAAPTPIRCVKAEKYAVGKLLNEENIKCIASLALDDANPRNSWRGSKDYRLNLVKVLIERSLSEHLVKSEV